MYSEVFLKISVTGKSLMAYLAFERLLPCMFPLVNDQVHLGVIPLRAAMVRTSVLVYHLRLAEF